MTLFSIVLSLFLIMDPFGNIATFLAVMERVKPKKRIVVIVREMFIALGVMLVFYFLGDILMDLLQVSAITVRIASGAILFLIAIKILFPSTNSLRMQIQNSLSKNEEPFVVPLAIPLIAGPSLIATIILFAQLEPSHLMMLSGIVIAWFFASLILIFGPFIERVLTHNGLVACERLMGMVLVLLAIQRFLEGVKLFVESCR